MKKILNKKLDEKAMLAGIFAFAALGFLYLYVAATVNNTEAPTKEIPQPQSIATTQDVQSSKNGMKKYRSNFLKVEFEYPEKYIVEEKVTSVILKKNDELSGEIIFSKYGTNYENTKLYIDDIISKWKNKPNSRTNFNSLHLQGELLHTQADNYNVIYFVNRYAVYQFETGDESLFSDLETIAKSFTILE